MGDYLFLSCIVSQLAGKLRLGKKSAAFWCMIIFCTTFIFSGILMAVSFLVTGSSDLEKLQNEIDKEIGDDLGLNYKDRSGIGAVIFFFVMICGPTMAVVFLLRGKLRKIRNIGGNRLEDCCLSVFCTQGVVAQIWWEINSSFMRNACEFSDKV